MKETVIISAWQRPDFLHACLSRLMVADDGKPNYLITLDRGHTEEVRSVALSWSKTMGRTVVLTPKHGYQGNSYNVLNAYKFALRNGADRVYLVEDDVLVGHDFFPFHRAAHRLSPEALSVSACRNQFFPMGIDPEPDPELAYAHMSYQSLGVSFSRESLLRVVPHIGHAYFVDPVGYCRENFPDSKINPSNAEQDGLIHRVGERDGLPTVYPWLPRAYHAGFVGYHRAGRRMTGTVEERSAKILGMDSDAMNRMAVSYKDHVVVDLDEDRSSVRKLVDPSFV